MAALLELARALQQADCVPEYTVVIVAFDLEELGSDGSQQFIQAWIMDNHCHDLMIAGIPPSPPPDWTWTGPRRGTSGEVTVCRSHHHGLHPGI